MSTIKYLQNKVKHTDS